MSIGNGHSIVILFIGFLFNADFRGCRQRRVIVGTVSTLVGGILLLAGARQEVLQFEVEMSWLVQDEALIVDGGPGQLNIFLLNHFAMEWIPLGDETGIVNGNDMSAQRLRNKRTDVQRTIMIGSNGYCRRDFIGEDLNL